MLSLLELFDVVRESTVGGLAAGVSGTVLVLEDSSLLVTQVAVSGGGSLAGFVSLSNSGTKESTWSFFAVSGCCSSSCGKSSHKAQISAVISARASSRTSRSVLHDSLRLAGGEQVELGENIAVLARSDGSFKQW